MQINEKLISFEGIDYSGKSTQIHLLTKRLVAHGQKVITLREPGGTEISEQIRNILLDKKNLKMHPACELLLYSAARIQILHEKIRPGLQSGHFVLMDRYIDSTTAYQGYGRKLSLDFIDMLNYFVSDDILPGITFFLDLDPSGMTGRKTLRETSDDRLESTGSGFYQNIYEGYLKIADNNKKRIKVLNGNRPVEKIAQEIWEFVRDKYTL
jgi:dTMP kinase